MVRDVQDIPVPIVRYQYHHELQVERQGCPIHNEVFPPTLLSHHHWQIQSDQEQHPAHSYPNRKQPHVPLHQNSGTGQRQTTTQHRKRLCSYFLRKLEEFKESQSVSFGNNRDRNDAGKYIPQRVLIQRAVLYRTHSPLQNS